MSLWGGIFFLRPIIETVSQDLCTQEAILGMQTVVILKRKRYSLTLALKRKMRKLKSHLLSGIVRVLGQLVLKGRSSVEELLIAFEKIIVNYSTEPSLLACSSYQQLVLCKMWITAYMCIPCPI